MNPHDSTQQTKNLIKLLNNLHLDVCHEKNLIRVKTLLIMIQISWENQKN